MSGSLLAVSCDVSGGENVPDIPGAYTILNFTYLLRDPWEFVYPMEIDIYQLSVYVCMYYIIYVQWVILNILNFYIHIHILYKVF